MIFVQDIDDGQYTVHLFTEEDNKETFFISKNGNTYEQVPVLLKKQGSLRYTVGKQKFGNGSDEISCWNAIYFPKMFFFLSKSTD